MADDETPGGRRESQMPGFKFPNGGFPPCRPPPRAVSSAPMLAALLSDPNFWISLLTLTVLEIVLGIDNIIFISILAGKLPPEKQARARTLGLMIALVTRVLLLFSIFWLTKLTGELFKVFAHSVSGKDLVMLGGGLFLLWKSVHEIHGTLEGEDHAKASKGGATMASVIAQIVVIDIVFSLDSVITAVGLAKHIEVMVAAAIWTRSVVEKPRTKYRTT